MSKKKNTLKDLDEFLKQQAATLAPPAKLSEKVDAPPPTADPPAASAAVGPEHISDQLEAWASSKGEGFREELYTMLIRVLEKRGTLAAEDRMLINTCLYLLHGENWKEAIRDYWKKRS